MCDFKTTKNDKDFKVEICQVCEQQKWTKKRSSNLLYIHRDKNTLSNELHRNRYQQLFILARFTTNNLIYNNTAMETKEEKKLQEKVNREILKKGSIGLIEWWYGKGYNKPKPKKKIKIITNLNFE